MAKQPNIIFFMMDQLSAKWLEGDSAKACPTPNINRLRKLGVSFSHAFTSNPVCCPARATLLTGLTTREHGVLQNGYELDPAIPNFVQSLQRAGWQTAAFGKVHVLSHYHSVYPDYHPYGFDMVHNTEDPRSGEWLDWVEQKYPEHYESVLAYMLNTKLPELKQYGKAKANLYERILKAKEKYPGNRPYPYHVLPYTEEVSQTAWITNHALDFIFSANPGRPFFAQISYVQPHSPFCPPETFMDRVDVAQIPVPIQPEWLDDPLAPKWFGQTEDARREIPDKWREYRQHYLADVAYLDHKLGQVMDALQESGQWENTFLILLADHGELLMDHGFSGKAERHYDACVRIPLIIAGPGLQAGSVCDAFVQLEDLAPTVFEIAGLPQPTLPIGGIFLKEEPNSLPGHSLLAWCRGEKPAAWRDSAYIESYNNIYTSTPDRWARTIRTNDWRYTYYPQGSGEQLFHLSVDPSETRNLAAEMNYQSVRREMRDRLLDAIILQDYPHPRRSIFSLGVH